MCKCRALEAENMDAYMLDTLDEEERAYQDVLKATTDDFARTTDKLRRSPTNQYLLKHVFDLIRYIRSDDCFLFMDMNRDTYIDLMLAGAGVSLRDVIHAASHKPAFL